MKKLCFTIFISIFISVISVFANETNLSNEKSDSDKGYIAGKIIWNGHNLKGATVQVFKDPKMKEVYTQGILMDPNGGYALEIEDPGTYYILAFVDDNGNGKFDAGDGMGIYGVSDWADPNQKPAPIKVESGKQLVDMDIEITSMADDKGQIKPLYFADHPNMKTGITGRVILPDHKFKNTNVFVYTDPTWSNRVAQAKVSEDGEFAISLPAGKYYLLAVIDENQSDLLDAGDKFGIWGMTKFGMYPKPIIIQEGNIRANRNILIIGKINEKGKPIPFQNPINDNIKQESNIIVSGKVIWAGHNVKDALVQVYSDPSLTSAIAVAKADDKGNFKLNLPEGEYYITAGVDTDGDGKWTKGDGIGAYGSDDATNLMPKKFIVTKEKANDEINIDITSEFDSNGQLIPTEKKEETEKEELLKPEITGISGKIIWTDHKFIDAIMVLAKDPAFEEGVRIPLRLGDDYSYTVSTEVGVYYIMVIIDENGNEKTDSGDGIGFYGTVYNIDGHWGEPQAVTIFSGRVTPYINIRISAMIGDDGKPSPTQDGIRMYFGDPNSVFNTDEYTQEWWYWSKGLAFTWTKADEGWQLKDVYQFEPKETTYNSKEDSSGIIYYIFDNNIWTVNPDGTNKRLITSGKTVTGTFEGDRLLFFDGFKGLEIFLPSEQALLELDWNQVSPQASISNDGKSIAFVRESSGNKKIVIRNIENGNEIIVPGLNMEMSYPSLSPDGELLAYSASSTTDQDQKESKNRDIYYYDIIAKRTERVTTSPQDDFNPAWSPAGLRNLVFCRSEDGYNQLWIVSFDAYGRPTEQQ
ncbi:MAG: TolB family protein, partial [Candidatus Poribacteria bacterium]